MWGARPREIHSELDKENKPIFGIEHIGVFADAMRVALLVFEI